MMNKDDFLVSEKSNHREKIFLCLQCFLIGALIIGVILAVIVVLYVLKIEYSSGTLKRETTTAVLRWNSTGTIIAGKTSVFGTAPDLLKTPYDLTLDGSNTLYIVDSGNNRIQKFPFGSLNGTTVAGQNNGIAGSSAIQLSSPIGILLDSNDDLLITDSGNHRAQLWMHNASSGSTIIGTGVSGNGLNQLNVPRDIIQNEITNMVYLADRDNHRVMAYENRSSIGKVIAGGNGCGLNKNQLCTPYGLVYDAKTDTLIVSTFSTHTIMRWSVGSSNGTRLMGTHGTSGISSTQFNTPTGIYLDPIGNLYVADRNNHRIQIILAGQENATTIAGISGVSGNTANHLNSPFWITLDTQLNLYVADSNNHRIMKFLRY